MTGWTEAVLLRAAALGPRVAVTEAAGGATLTYGTLAVRAPLAAQGLRRRGLRPGDPVVVLLRGGCHLPVAGYAVLAAGGVVVSIPGGPAAAGARIMITDRDDADAIAQESNIRQVYSFTGVPGTAGFDSLFGADGPVAPTARLSTARLVAADDVALVAGADLRAYDMVLGAGARLVAAHEPDPAECRRIIAGHGVTLLIDERLRVVPVRAHDRALEANL
ncbi:AMP-binding protein [Nonomuraea sp. WAC 01424]|uniref:AMP-binding protein n=1 Tax=Nonomuraea sp. WAC 01424 TaxID=2203200 RepID=UPI00163BAF7C|nr:AMP-binding protein [Nonomuraea sp. WAC 01424]